MTALTLTLKRYFEGENNYGTKTHWAIFEDAEGNAYKYSGTAAFRAQAKKAGILDKFNMGNDSSTPDAFYAFENIAFEPGNIWEITATLGATTTYRGVEQIKLTRPQIKDITLGENGEAAAKEFWDKLIEEDSHRDCRAARMAQLQELWERDLAGEENLGADRAESYDRITGIREYERKFCPVHRNRK